MGAIRLHIHGPGFDDIRVLRAGSAELVVGRDAKCDVGLPDPAKTISRRHLSVWNINGQMGLRVLSVVNGVDLPDGEIPPGAEAVLHPGQTLQLGDYQLHVLVDNEPGTAGDTDPWAVFQDSVSPTVPLKARPAPPAASAPPPVAATPSFAPEDDPFVDWSFETANLGQAAMNMPLPQGPTGQVGLSGELVAFYRGLGIDPARIGQLSEGEVETVGRIVRRTLEGLLALQADNAEMRRDLKADERTTMARRDTNPLNANWPLESKLQYLLGGRAFSIGFTNPEAALDETLTGLRIHEVALAAAAHAVVEGTLREFEPDALRSKLMGGKARIAFLDNARLWELYSRHFEERSRKMDEWLTQLFDRHFTSAYLRESQRIKRER